MNTFATLIASNLDWLMARAKTNANDLAATLARQSPTGKSVTQATIFRIVNGESKDPKTASIQPLADYFGVSVQELRERDFRLLGFPSSAGEGVAAANPEAPAAMPPEIQEILSAYNEGGPAKQEALRRLAELPEPEMATLLLVIQSIGAKYKT